MKKFSQKLVFGGWIFWTSVSGFFGLFCLLQEAKSDVDFCLNKFVLLSPNKNLKKHLKLYLEKFNTSLDHWTQDQKQSLAGLYQLKDMSSRLNDFIFFCDDTETLLGKKSCQNSTKKLETLLPSTPCTHPQVRYQNIYSRLSSQISRYYTWIKEFFGLTKRSLTPLMLATCLGNEAGIEAILNQDPKTLKQKDRTGKTAYDYVPLQAAYEVLAKRRKIHSLLNRHSFLISDPAK